MGRQVGLMKRTALLDNIRNQPSSLRRVAAYHLGDGEEELRVAAGAIRAAGRVVFTGMGSSLFASIPAADYLNAHGIEAQVIEASELLHFGEGGTRGAALVLVSRSGETVEISKLLAALNGSQTATIGVTNVRESLLARQALHALYLNSESDWMVAVQTYTGTLAALVLLAAAALEEPLQHWRATLDDSARALSEAIDDAIAGSDDWNDFLAGAGVVYLLGRGPSLASVREGALLLNEASWTPSVAISAGQFRHGPVEVVDERFRGIVYASQPATRELDLALARDLTSMGGKVRVCQGRGVSASLEPLIEIAGIQVASCRLAETKGIDPGGVRHATLVTRTETGFGTP
jgi:glucosamine--fructose-6-phosphate aminotransferase (isomerizing)